jgi:aldehyde:ferredoxin oxidoreductase
LSHFTALLENDDLDTAFRANLLCNEYGMDTVSAGSTLACYREITGADLTPETILRLVEEMGQGVGLGKELGRGSLSYAEKHEHPELSMSVKGLELPAYDPRGAYGMALAYATSTRGGCHLRAYPISHEILRKPVVTDRFSFSGKARIIKIAEDLNAIVDSLNVCKFAFFASSLEEYAKVFAAVTGVDMTAHDLSEIGERIYYHERMMNAAVGFDAKDDDLPRRFFATPGTDGPSFNVPPIDREAFLACRHNYYKVRGLDDNGLPIPEKASALGLPWTS